MKLTDESKSDAEDLGAALVDVADTTFQYARSILVGAIRQLRQKRDAKRAEREADDETGMGTHQ
jgi:hypothetical protein